MKVLVDSSVWSLALRKNSKPDDPAVRELQDLIHDLRVAIIGPIRQELLSGISDVHRYSLLKDTLRHFEDTPIDAEHCELAAALYNQCRSAGIQGCHIDFLICATAIRNDFLIFTTDKDFLNYQKHMEIKLHGVR